METIVIDGSQMSGRQAAHQHLAERLSFPGYYGRNLDALYDLLSEREGPTRLLVPPGGSVGRAGGIRRRTVPDPGGCRTGQSGAGGRIFGGLTYTKMGYSKYTIVG